MKKQKNISRREFVITSAVGTLGIASGFTLAGSSPVVSVVRIKDDNIAGAVEEAIEWLGGIEEVCRDKQRIMLKPEILYIYGQAKYPVQMKKNMNLYKLQIQMVMLLD